jgi:sugar (pentulose or hexulose) kinase
MTAGGPVLAIDVGSSAIRAAVVDGSGAVLAVRRAPRQDGESGLTFDPEALWKDVVATAAAVVAGARRRDIRGIGIAGHIGTVLVDRSLTPVCPGRGWADSQGVADLRALLGPDRTAQWLRTSGRSTVTGGALAALVHLRAEAPQTFARVAYALHPKDFIIARLTGTVATDHTSAAYTGASVVRDRNWATEVMESVGVPPGLLPAQRRSTEPVATTTDAASRLLGLPPDVPVVAGGPDGTVGATLVLGSRREAVADIAGTTDVLVRVVDDPKNQPAAATLNPYTMDGLWTIGGPTGMTGGTISWWAQLLGHETAAAALERLWPQMAEIGPGADGVIVDPSLSGSRFPRWRSEERGAVQGLHSRHGAAHVMLAVLEAVAYSVREGVDALAGEATGLPIVLAGGTARSAHLAQLRADVLGREVTVCAEPDVSLLGAALLALVGTGDRALDEQADILRGNVRRFSPDPGRARAYDELYGRWRTATLGSADPGAP